MEGDYLNAIAHRKDTLYWVEWNLENWARHMKGIDLPDGMPVRASGGIEVYTSLDLDSVSAVEKMEAGLAETTGVVVASLPSAERSAIQHRYMDSQYEFWRFSLTYGDALASGMDLVEKGLTAKGVWLGQ